MSSEEKIGDRQSVENAVPKHSKILEVANADYALALSTGPQLSPTSWKSLQLFAILLVAYMGSLSNGFDGSGMLYCSLLWTRLNPRRSYECRKWHGVSTALCLNLLA